MSRLTDATHAWFRKVWTEEDPSAIDTLAVPELHQHGLGAQVAVDRESFKVFHAAILAQLTEMEFTIDKSLEEGDWISVLCTLRAKRRDTGAPVTLTGQGFARFDNGQLVEAYNHFDFLTLFEALDLLPQNTLGRCLGGERVG